LRFQGEETAHDLIVFGQNALIHALAKFGELLDTIAHANHCSGCWKIELVVAELIWEPLNKSGAAIAP